MKSAHLSRIVVSLFMLTREYFIIICAEVECMVQYARKGTGRRDTTEN
jgi:cytochrome bd-type quinol oxidase subunit 1